METSSCGVSSGEPHHRG